MDSRIEKLKKDYWAGETTLAEEKELKEYFKKNPALSREDEFHSMLRKNQNLKAEFSFRHPGRKNYSSWWSAAAAILVLLTVGFFLIQKNDTQEQFAIEDPKEAYEITRASLLKVSEGLNKGKTYSKELIKINKAKESITY